MMPSPILAQRNAAASDTRTKSDSGLFHTQNKFSFCFITQGEQERQNGYPVLFIPEQRKPPALNIRRLCEAGDGGRKISAHRAPPGNLCWR
jgi:hypothetical protein